MLMARFLLSNEVPGLLLAYFKRPKVNVYQYLVLAFEIRWHSPRVPTGATSPKAKSAGGKRISLLVNDSDIWRRSIAAILVFLARPAND